MYYWQTFTLGKCPVEDCPRTEFVLIIFELSLVLLLGDLKIKVFLYFGFKEYDDCVKKKFIVNNFIFIVYT